MKFAGDNGGRYLTYLLYFAINGEKLAERRQVLQPHPEWLLVFRPPMDTQCRSFIDSVYNGILLQMTVKAREFHSETGIIAKIMYDYINSITSIDRAITFFNKYISYMRGEKLFFPFNQGPDKDLYRALKTKSQSSYAKRLIKEFKERGLTSENWTQDYTALYRVDAQSLVELILCSVSFVNVVDEIEKFRINGS